VKVRLATLVAALVVGACEGTPAPRLDQPGDPCRGDTQRCLDEGTVLRCAGLTRVELTCDEVCGELGPAWVADGCARECLCVPADPSSCWPGETSCVNAQTLEQCDDAQSLEPIDCMQLCADAGLSSVGCIDDTDAFTGAPFADCFCSAEGTPCSPSAAPICVDAATLAQCEDGTWSFQACADLCGAPSQCVPWQTPAACEC
jgi:hypothetical protein